MLHSRCNNKIKHLHERCLCVICNGKRSSYEDLLMKDGSISIHALNTMDVTIKMFKVKNSLTPKIVNYLFDNETKNRHNLRHRTEFRLPFVDSVYCGRKNISCFIPKI